MSTIKEIMREMELGIAGMTTALKMLSHIDQQISLGKDLNEGQLSDFIIPSPAEIRNIVADCLSVPLHEMDGRCRYTNVVDARFISIKMIHDAWSPTVSLKEIGRLFGGRDHSTVIHSIKQAEEFMQTDFDFKEKFEKCMIAYHQRVSKIYNQNKSIEYVKDKN